MALWEYSVTRDENIRRLAAQPALRCRRFADMEKLRATVDKVLAAGTRGTA
jgi:hypothetical protein